MSQEQRQAQSLKTENEQLLKSLTDERTHSVAIDRELQAKEEELEETQEKFETDKRTYTQ